MKKLLLSLLLLSSAAFGSSNVNNVITFDGNDFFAINEPFTESLNSNFTEKISTFQGKELYIYFDSPGGSVIAMSRMIETMKNTKNVKFTCVARMAASAAFMTFEYCDKRYILPDGVLMSHNASGTFSDEFPRIRTLLDTIEGILIPIEKAVAKRMGLSYNKYKELINSNLWLNRFTATKYNAVDGVISNVKCSKETTERLISKTEETQTLFGTIVKDITVSACPLVTNTKTAPQTN